MEKLTNKEEEILMVLWQIKKGFVKDVMEELPMPKPHYNTISTIIRKMEEKGYVSHHAFGNTYEYFPVILKEEYRKNFMNKTILDYFENSYKNAVSFFAKEEKIKVEDLKDIIDLIEQKNK
jgi:predicted transcriptional regulator